MAEVVPPTHPSPRYTCCDSTFFFERRPQNDIKTDGTVLIHGLTMGLEFAW